MKSRKKRILLLAGFLIIGFPIAGRVHSWWSAIEFGRVYGYELEKMSASRFSDTEAMRKMFDEKLLGIHTKRTERLKFLGGGHHRRIEELKAGTLYLSGQASVPLAMRFTAVPEMEVLTLNTGDRTSQGLKDAAASLLRDYHKKGVIP